MKQIITAAITAGVVSLALVLFLSPAQEDNALVIKVDQLVKVSGANAANITQLLAEVSEIQENSNDKDHNSSPVTRSEGSVDSEGFLERISALEFAFAN